MAGAKDLINALFAKVEDKFPPVFMGIMAEMTIKITSLPILQLVDHVAERELFGKHNKGLRRKIMKKKLVLILVMFLLLFGCAGQMKQISQAVKDYVCDPTPEVKDTAIKMIAAIKAAQTLAGGFAPQVDIEKTMAVLTKLSETGCFFVSQLEEAFKTVDAANAATVKMKGPKVMAVTAMPQYPALRKYVK